MSENREFLGVGWKFPIQIDNEVMATSGYEDNIKESIRIILETSKGERVMRPDFGCGINDYVFETFNADTLESIERSVYYALEKWEPRIDSLKVSVNPDDIHDGKILIKINYRVRETNNQFNMVYPFYLTEGVGRIE